MTNKFLAEISTYTVYGLFWQCVECLLRVEYSGGPGLQASYCRQCAVNLSVDICPSVIIQAWDALPAERYWWTFIN